MPPYKKSLGYDLFDGLSDDSVSGEDEDKPVVGDKVDCKLAMRGLKVPSNYSHDITKLCIVRGIRYHPGFARELYGKLPEFTRALNARSIMSDTIPEMKTPDEFPYCIWHPEIAAESTYRQLAERYPQMKYLVGRACAVAGYLNLFHELKLLPEIHIAAEARDNGHEQMFQEIMSQDLYEVMDDYKRTTHEQSPRPGAFLNGDTAVLSSLNFRSKVDFYYSGLSEEFPHLVEEREFDTFPVLFDLQELDDWNLTEDSKIDIRGYKHDFWRTDIDPTTLLYEPLPKHLPNINKDLLICMAAFNGDIDRYARLRRPCWVARERECLYRGIYHNTAFAKWYAKNAHFQDDDLSAAIVARFIMSGNLSALETVPLAHLPDIIWYPQLGPRKIYEELAIKIPRMREQAARAMIVGGFKDSFVTLDPEPSYFLMIEAKGSPDHFYKEFLTRKATEQGKDVEIRPDGLPAYAGWIELNYRALSLFVGKPWFRDEIPEKRFMSVNDILWDNQALGWWVTKCSVAPIERNMLLEPDEKWNEPDSQGRTHEEQYQSDSDWEFEMEGLEKKVASQKLG